MIESDANYTPAESTVADGKHISSRISIAWALPLLALVFAGWVVWEAYTKRGPLVSIVFENAGGVAAGETRVRRNDVDVGRVESVRLSEDLDSVVVNVRMDPQVVPYLDDDTRFWIVNARINTTEIAGLSTLLSGSYIEVDWDDVPGERVKEFVGLDEPPLTKRGTPGLRISLTAEEAGYIYVGSPVFMRQLEVGRVERRRLSDDASQVLFDVFIQAPYHRHVYPDTRFYVVTGLDATIGPDSATVEVESIMAFFTGGIAFENPLSTATQTPVQNDTETYTLFDSRTIARENLLDGPADERYRLSAVFEGSVKGLRPGAPVEYNGVKVGEVSSFSVSLPEVSVATEDQGPGTASVVLQFQPRRMGMEGMTKEVWLEKMSALVNTGMRAQLSMGNLLTGSLIVKLVSDTQYPSASLEDSVQPYPEIPVVGSSVEAVTADVETLIKNLSELPLDTLIASATGVLQDARTLLASPDMVALPGQLNTSMASVNQVARQVENATANLPAMIRSLSQASDNANDVLEGLSPDSEIYIELSAAAKELRIAARSIAAFAELLEENPSAVLTGR